MSELAYSVGRSVLIRAPRDLVFRYFTDSARFAAWWGEGSRIEPKAGGEVVIRNPGGSIARGAIVEIAPPERVVFTYGYEDPSVGLQPGASRVTIQLSETREGTLLALRHDLPTEALRDHHVQGWRYQLTLFANVVCREAHAAAAAKVDAFFAAWSEPDDAARLALLRTAVTDDVSFRDDYGCLSGIEDLNANLAAVQRFLPGMKLGRTGDLAQCQGSALTAWKAEGPEGQPRGKGTSFFDFATDGRIARVAGFWEKSA